MKILFNRSIYIGAIFFFLIDLNFSQVQNFEVSGRIYNYENLEPVSNSLLYVLETNQYTTSSRDGFFSIKDIKLNKIKIKITHLAFYEKIIELSFENNQEKNLIIYLTPKTISLPPVVVSSNSQNLLEQEMHQFSTVLQGKHLQRNLSQTLASTLKNEVGISIRSMGPAPSRPVFRGLGQDRILISEDGYKTNDLSGTSPDHAVTLEPFNAERIEVLRGPKILTKSSTSFGGVVNVVKQDIPLQIHNQIHLNAGGYYETVNKGSLYSVHSEIPFNPLSAKLEISRRKTSDLKTPKALLKNSSSENINLNAGLSMIKDFGMIGGSFKIFNLKYGIPGGFVGAHPFGVNIDMEKQQFNLLSILTFKQNKLELKFSNVQYRHTEYESNNFVGSQFAINTNTADINFLHNKFSFFDEGIIGISVEHRDFNIGGYVFSPPSYSLNISSYLYEIYKTDKFNFESSIRYSFDKVIPKKERLSYRIGKISNRTFNNLSLSIACLYQISDIVYFGLNLSKTSRVPTIEELFSDGPHLAAYSFEVGNPSLESESGLGGEFYIHHKFEKHFFNLNVFYYSFDKFIIHQKTGEINYQTFLPIYRTKGVGANQYGFDGTAEFKFSENITFNKSISFVKGEFKNSKRPLPQIPPIKGQTGLKYSKDNFTSGLFLEWAGTQNRVDEFEDRTAGYLIFNLFFQYIFQTGHFINNIGVVVENLFNQEYRNHLSRVKTIMPEAGINARLIYKVMI